MEKEMQIPDGENFIEGHLHHTQDNLLVLLIHGHNSNIHKDMFVRIGEILHRNDISCFRMNVRREKFANGIVVSKVSEEVRQMKVVFDYFRSKYDKIIIAGHSQGGLVCLNLLKKSDGAILIMPVLDVSFHVGCKLAQIGARRSEIGEFYDLKSGKYLTRYYSDWFDDFETNSVDELLAGWQGPTLLIGGRLDQIVLKNEIEEGFEKIKGEKELAWVSAPHQFSENQAEEVANKMVEWINKLFFGKIFGSRVY